MYRCRAEYWATIGQIDPLTFFCTWTPNMPPGRRASQQFSLRTEEPVPSRPTAIITFTVKIVSALIQKIRGSQRKQINTN